MLVAVSGQRAFAALHFAAAHTEIETMPSERRIPQVQIEAAEADLQRALALWPGHPRFLDYRAQLATIQAGQAGVVGAERTDLLTRAAGDYRRSLSGRPLWPYSWAKLLSVKDKLGELDSEFNEAMHRAVETGPWEPGVQIHVLDSGLRHWGRLGDTERNLVRTTVAQALEVQPRNVFAMVRNHGRPDLVCGAKAEYAHIKRWCERVTEMPANGVY